MPKSESESESEFFLLRGLVVFLGGGISSSSELTRLAAAVDLDGFGLDSASKMDGCLSGQRPIFYISINISNLEFTSIKDAGPGNPLSSLQVPLSTTESPDWTYPLYYLNML